MKEATGELNMTMIVVIAVGLLTAFFYFTIWPAISNNMNETVKCNKAVCSNQKNDDGTVDCVYNDTDIKCVWKG